MGSYVSCWGGPPSSQTRITERSSPAADPRAAPAPAPAAGRRGPGPPGPRNPALRKLRRVTPSQHRNGRPGKFSIATSPALGPRLPPVLPGTFAQFLPRRVSSRNPLVQGVDPTVTLVANSIPYSRGRLQRRESRAAGPRQRRPRPPLAEPHHVDRRRRQEVLKVRLRLTDIATPPSIRTVGSLVHASPRCPPGPRTATGTPPSPARGGPPAAPRAAHAAAAR